MGCAERTRALTAEMDTTWPSRIGRLEMPAASNVVLVEEKVAFFCSQAYSRRLLNKVASRPCSLGPNSRILRRWWAIFVS